MKNLVTILTIAALSAGIVSARAIPVEGHALARDAYPIGMAEGHTTNSC